MNSQELAELRKNYSREALDEAAAHADPFAQFARWFDEALAARLPEPNAMTLATVGADARPSTRVVLIKGFDARGIVWYTNYGSRKGRELASNPHAALQFHWVELERVVRIEGRVEKTSDTESDAYFATRPLDSRIGAWASPQSEVIASRSVLVGNAAKFAARFALLRHARRIGAASGSFRTAGSSGKVARAGCTTGCATAATATRSAARAAGTVMIYCLLACCCTRAVKARQERVEVDRLGPVVIEAGLAVRELHVFGRSHWLTGATKSEAPARMRVRTQATQYLEAIDVRQLHVDHQHHVRQAVAAPR